MAVTPLKVAHKTFKFVPHLLQGDLYSTPAPGGK
jgi:hypothetical protein